MCYISNDNKYIFSGSLDNTIKIWDLKNGTEIRTLEGHSKGILHFDVTKDDKFLVSGAIDLTLKKWDIFSGKEIFTIDQYTNKINKNNRFACTISPDNKFILSGSDDGLVRVWDFNTGNNIRNLLGNKNEPVRKSFVTSDNKFIVGWQHTVHIWDRNTYSHLFEIDGGTSNLFIDSSVMIFEPTTRAPSKFGIFNI